MKKQVNVPIATALTIAFLIVATALAGNPEIVRINKGEAAKTIDIQLANLQKLTTEVVLQDLDGKYWYSEQIWKQDGYYKRLNLNGMPNGHYICYVKNRNVLHTQSFCLNETDLEFYESTGTGNLVKAFTVRTGDKRPVVVWITSEDAGTICLQLANLQEQETLIRLNVLGDGIAFQQRVSREQAVAENIHLEGMYSGVYFLHLKIGNASVIQFFEYSPAAGVHFDARESLEQSPAKSAGLVQN